jgi:tetratricopeptide (TPR) repeat protein
MMSSRDRLTSVCIFALLAFAAASCSKGPANKDELLARANEALAAAQYDKAEKGYREVLQLDQADAAAQRQLGILYQEQGQAAKAYPLLKQQAERQPDDKEVLLKLALTALAGGNLGDARDAAQRVLDGEPGHEEALMVLVGSALDQNAISETRDLIQSSRQKDRDRPGYHLALGALDLRQADPAHAEGEFKAALALDPQSEGARTALAYLYWSRNDLAAADQAFKAAADAAPLNSPMRLRYADFKLRTGAVAEAKTILEEITSKFPDYLPPHTALMKIACQQHRDEDCATRVQDVLGRDSANFDALFQEGLLGLDKDDAARAIRAFGYLANNYALNPQVRYQLARAYLLYAKTATPVNSRNAIDTAERSLTDAVKVDAHFDPAVLALAEIKIQKGSPVAAVDLLVPLTKDRPQLALAHYLLASAYLAQQKRDEALAVYRQMMELFPKDPQPPFIIGTALLAQGQRSEAQASLEKSLGISEDYLPAVERLVDLDIADQQYATAMDRVQKRIDHDSTRALLWSIRAKIYLAQRDFTHAEEDLLKSIELDPKVEPNYLLLAQLYVASRQPERAIEKLTAFTKDNKDVAALMQLGTIHESLNHHADARDAYEKVLSVNANFTPALNNLAVVYSEHLGQLDTAYNLAKKATELAPNEPHMVDTLGWILFKKGRYSNALQELEASASKLPESPAIQFHLGMTHYMLGEEGPARLALEKAVGADSPDREEARRRLAILAIDPRTADAAAQHELQNYLREQPDDPAALLRLAEIQEREGAIDPALKTYQKVVEGSPEFSPALRRLAVLLGERSPTDPKTYDLAQRAREAFPQDAEVAKTLGILSYRRDYYQRAADLLQEAAAKNKDDPNLLYYLGEAYYQLKHWSDCKSTLERALNLNLAPGLAGTAKQTLAECSAPAAP